MSALINKKKLNKRLFKTYHEVVRACDRTAIFQVMGFCIVTCKQPPRKDKQKQQVNLRGFILKNQSQCLKPFRHCQTCMEESDVIQNLTLL